MLRLKKRKTRATFPDAVVKTVVVIDGPGHNVIDWRLRALSNKSGHTHFFGAFYELIKLFCSQHGDQIAHMTFSRSGDISPFDCVFPTISHTCSHRIVVEFYWADNDDVIHPSVALEGWIRQHVSSDALTITPLRNVHV